MARHGALVRSPAVALRLCRRAQRGRHALCAAERSEFL